MKRNPRTETCVQQRPKRYTRELAQCLVNAVPVKVKYYFISENLPGLIYATDVYTGNWSTSALLTPAQVSAGC